MSAFRVARSVSLAFCSVVAFLISIALALPVANAGCYAPDYIPYWGFSSAPRTQIHVYVTTGGVRDVSVATGLSDAQVIAVVQDAIRRWNDTSAAGPRLRYVSSLNVDTALEANRPTQSIVVDGTICGSTCGGANGVACHIPSSGVPGKSRISLYPENCSLNPLDWSLGHAGPDTPLPPVLLHEFGHALGLLHTDQACPAPYVQTNGGGNVGVMNAEGDFLLHRTWEPRRDDVTTLAALYGGSEELAVWQNESTDSGVNWTANAVVGATARSPVSLSSSAYATDDRQAFAYISLFNQVHFRRGAFSGWSPVENPGSIVEAGVSGISFEPPSVAQGRTSALSDRFMIAWSSGESTTTWQHSIRVATRTTTGTSYAYSTPASVAEKSFGLGFSDRRKFFVLARVDPDGDLIIETLSPSTGVLIAQTVVQMDVADVGNPACYDDGVDWCAIPYLVGTGPNAYSLGFLEGGITAAGAFVATEDSVITSRQPRGAHLTLGSDPRSDAVTAGFFGVSNEQPQAQVYRATRGDAIVGVPATAGSVSWGTTEWRSVAAGVVTRNAQPQLKVRRAWIAPN